MEYRKIMFSAIPGMLVDTQAAVFALALNRLRGYDVVVSANGHVYAKTQEDQFVDELGFADSEADLLARVGMEDAPSIVIAADEAAMAIAEAIGPKQLDLQLLDAFQTIKDMGEELAPTPPVAMDDVVLPMDGMSIILRTDGHGGYKAFIQEAGETDEVEAFSLSVKRKRVGKWTLRQPELYLNLDHEDDKVRQRHSLLTPSGRPRVIQREDGTLYCRKCRCTVPNTANSEMRKEGAFAHSHCCGIRQQGEVYEEG